MKKKNQARNKTSMSGLVAFITDFGILDGYVAEMYASLLTEAPEARIIDITHSVKPGDIQAGAFILGRVFKRFPEETAFVCVIDPGVGSDRQAVLIRSYNRYFVGPDNGLFTYVVDWDGDFEVRELTGSYTEPEPISRTFHGRDLFAPIAGKIASGVSFESLGISSKLICTNPPPVIHKVEGGWKGEILYIDGFGNLATNLPNDLSGNVKIGEYSRIQEAKCYSDQPEGQAFFLKGSNGFIEIAINRGSAAEILNISRGDSVVIKAVDRRNADSG